LVTNTNKVKNKKTKPIPKRVRFKASAIIHLFYIEGFLKKKRKKEQQKKKKKDKDDKNNDDKADTESV
jgi:hypothetical protein